MSGLKLGMPTAVPLRLMVKYLDGKEDLTHDEIELLLFTLYLESLHRCGLACEGVKVLSL